MTLVNLSTIRFKASSITQTTPAALNHSRSYFHLFCFFSLLKNKQVTADYSEYTALMIYLSSFKSTTHTDDQSKQDSISRMLATYYHPKYHSDHIQELTQLIEAGSNVDVYPKHRRGPLFPPVDFSYSPIPVEIPSTRHSSILNRSDIQDSGSKSWLVLIIQISQVPRKPLASITFSETCDVGFKVESGLLSKSGFLLLDRYSYSRSDTFYSHTFGRSRDTILHQDGAG